MKAFRRSLLLRSPGGGDAFRQRRPATKVMVFQVPCGTLPISRSPRGARPAQRAMLVQVPGFIDEDQASGSSLGCFSDPMPAAPGRHQARCCSAARRLFFEADVVAVEEPPDRSKPSLVVDAQPVDGAGFPPVSGRVPATPIQVTTPRAFSAETGSGPCWFWLQSYRSLASAWSSGSPWKVYNE